MNKVVYFEDIGTAEPLPPLVKPPVDKVQLVRYAGASGDFNPLHFMDEVGQAAGTGGVIAHGMLIMGFVGEAVTRWVPNHNLKRLSVRFVNVTRPGDQITVSGKITETRLENAVGTVIGEVTATDQNGSVKLKGSFEASLPVKDLSS